MGGGSLTFRYKRLAGNYFSEVLKLHLNDVRHQCVTKSPFYTLQKIFTFYRNPKFDILFYANTHKTESASQHEHFAHTVQNAIQTGRVGLESKLNTKRIRVEMRSVSSRVELSLKFLDSLGSLVACARATCQRNNAAMTECLGKQASASVSDCALACNLWTIQKPYQIRCNDVSTV